MTKHESHIPVTIVGGGPVGLFLAICLLKKDIPCKVIEKRTEPVPDSRSLGIHPVSLELFDELGITDPFLENGLKIKKGIALTERKMLGKISFEHCPKPHNYILACPQFATEKILRNELKKLNQKVLITGVEFEQFEQHESFITTTYSTKNQTSEQITSHFLIGCDGKNSLVRKQASIHYSGKRYNDTYIMGDFADNTYFGDDATVFLPKNGLIECFPLPNGMRRWVVKTDEYIPNPTQDMMAALVLDRIGHDISGIENTMLSSFGVQHFVAETFAKGRVLLAGDAAHVVSPIGGQGMNLGWLGAHRLADIISEVPTPKGAPQYPLTAAKNYSSKQRKIAKKVARRAEINMRLGRKQSIPLLRNLFVQTMLHSPLKTKIAELFTMRGLNHWWI